MTESKRLQRPPPPQKVMSSVDLQRSFGCVGENSSEVIVLGIQILD